MSNQLFHAEVLAQASLEVHPPKHPQNFVIPDGAADPEPMPLAETRSMQVRNDNHYQFCNSTREAWVPDIAWRFRNDETLRILRVGLGSSCRSPKTLVILGLVPRTQPSPNSIHH